MYLNLIASAVLGFVLAGCAADAGRLCRPGEQASTIETVYFGTDRKAANSVTPEEWRQFVGEIVTPRFPQGLTWWKAHGQWRNTAGTIEREKTYVLQIVHPDTEPVEPALLEIAERYREKFDQHVVLRVTSPGCMSYQGQRGDDNAVR